jgi:hypothetical protein
VAARLPPGEGLDHPHVQAVRARRDDAEQALPVVLEADGPGDALDRRTCDRVALPMDGRQQV